MKILSLLLLAAFAFFASQDADNQGPLNLSYKTYDHLLSSNLKKEIEPRIVIIDIDENSLAQKGRWPWSRTTMARLITNLHETYNVSITGLDILFAEPEDTLTIKQYLNNPSITPDQQLTQVIKKHPVVLAHAFHDNPTMGSVGSLGKSITNSQDFKDVNLLEKKEFIGNLDLLVQSSVRSGYFDHPTIDSDGVHRKFPLIQKHQEKVYPSLSIAIWQELTFSDQITPIIETDLTEKPHLSALSVGGRDIPTNNSGIALIPYNYSSESYQRISAKDILNKTADRNQLNGAIALVGTSAAGLNDLVVTPITNQLPGVDIHAQILSSLFNNTFYYAPDYGHIVETVLIAILGLFVIWVSRKNKAFVTFLTLSIALASIWFSQQWLFTQQSIFLPTSFLMLSLISIFISEQILAYTVEQRRRKHLTTTFARYIPPDIAKSLSTQAIESQLSGEQKELTIMFADIRDFTSLSEKLTPKQVTETINIALSQLTQIIFENGGTVDKYIGDCIMAFWGAPQDDSNHAQHALTTAKQMIIALPKINSQLECKGLPEIKLGIGLNTGQAMVGNMGSELRTTYTAIGDAVNIASRVEQLTKEFSQQILLTEATALKSGTSSNEFIAEVTLKGKTDLTKVFSPL